MTIERIDSFDAIQRPSASVVVADRALPEHFLSAFDEPILVEAGESLKRLGAVERLAERVLAQRASRPMTVVAVGGGSVGDAVGFLASTLWRGVDLWHVPTTLLAMVDSSHGGKTAVNLGSAKNQLGTFHPAQRVVLVEEALATLPRRQRREGLAELLKALWVGDSDSLKRLRAKGGVGRLAAAPYGVIADRLWELLERAISVKRELVRRDPRETEGLRAILNFGHTLGHALELRTGLAHGEAVAWGMSAASWLSERYAGLSEEAAGRLRSDVAPLVRPLARVRDFDDLEGVVDAVGRDKKQREGRLRAVLLEEPGAPVVSEETEAHDWYDAFRRSVTWVERAPLHVVREDEFDVSLPVSASKSEMNRALVIRHLRPGVTTLCGESEADDVVRLERALRTLKEGGGESVVDAGEGGTTFRFLCAVAAIAETPTVVAGSPELFERPHRPLFEALERAGASLERIEVGPSESGASPGGAKEGIRVEPAGELPKRFVVTGRGSSQYASALALLSARGDPIRLQIEGGAQMPSRPYFEMTLELLERSGVACVEASTEGEERRLEFRPTPRLDEEVALEVTEDASSRAVWEVGRLCGLSESAGGSSRSSGGPVTRQPDLRAAELVDRLSRGSSDERNRERIDLGASPDLAPVLAAASTQIATGVLLEGAAHLRHKESDRIETLVDRLGAVGIEAEPRSDGLEIPAGRQHPDPGSSWDPAGDHRLAMAGLLLSAAGEGLWIERPGVVAKSYPEFWDHARRLGWRIRRGRVERAGERVASNDGEDR